MASSGTVCIRFIIQNTHNHKLIPIITRECSSKNKEIRKTLYEVHGDFFSLGYTEYAILGCYTDFSLFLPSLNHPSLRFLRCWIS